MFVLAHISDVHLPLDGRPRTRELLSQRILGYANWKRGRDQVHRAEVLAKITDHMVAQRPDHIAVTGDLVNVAAQREWPGARAFLDSLGSYQDVTVIPGNHDAYVGGGVPGMVAAFDPNMRGDTGHHASDGSSNSVRGLDGRFPFVRLRGNVALIACSSAVPTAPFMATGRLGQDQLTRLEEELNALKAEGRVRVVLIHHPPIPGLASARRRLSDDADLAALFERTGAELVLHGHNHTATATMTPGPDAPVPIIGVPSTSARTHGERPAAQYNLLRFEGPDHAPSVTLERYGILRDEKDPVELFQKTDMAGAALHQPVHPLAAEQAASR
ncbi:MAG: metallophosphoesterase [Pseudomonadota bacterium]